MNVLRALLATHTSSLHLHHLNQIHSFLITSSLSQDTSFLTKFLHSLLTSHHHANQHIKIPNTIQPCNPLVLYSLMHRNSIHPSKHTFPLLLKLLSKFKKQVIFVIYCHVIKFGFDLDNFVRNSLISAFAKCGYVQFARKVFDESGYKDLVAWTAMIDGYIKNGFALGGLRCFVEMRNMGVEVDEVSVVSALCGAGKVGDVWFGRWVHGFYVESGRVKWDVCVGSTLLDMYAKCGCCDDARRVFDEMLVKNVVSWSALIVGYMQCNRFKDALVLFQDMLKEDVKPNESTLTSVLSLCAQMGSLDLGRWVHRYIDSYSLGPNSMLGTALIDMYVKCGCIAEGFQVLNELDVKDVYPWTAMINGLAMHGHALESLNLFSQMVSSGVQPNGVTFIGILSACSHGGLVDEGLEFFELMKHRYHLEPNVDHYGCMVDTLGRAGYLEEAMKLIESMPMEPSPGVWGALFGACMIHKDFELGKYIGNLLIRLQPNHSGRYVLLANMYSACHKWDSAAYVRKLMKGKLIEKTPGFSWVEVNGLIHEFISFDNSHPQVNDLYEMLDNIMFQLRLSGHHWETNLLTFDIDGG